MMMSERAEKGTTAMTQKPPAVPLQICCTVCGAPPEFDIVEQKYHCQNCGAFIGIAEPVVELNGWRALRDKELRAVMGESGCEIHACQNCGAQVVIPAGEAEGACEFCGGKLVRRAFREQEDFPEVIIPFYLTLEEARAQLKQWAAENKGKKEAEALLSQLENLRGYYLPYQLVKGPMSCHIKRDQTFSVREFACRSYLQGLAVNTSQQLDNQVLNAAEPFDWNELKPFEFGYVAGQRIKLADLQARAAVERIEEEVEEDYRPVVEKVLETTGLSLDVEAGNLLTVSALLPVYILQEVSGGGEQGEGKGTPRGRGKRRQSAARKISRLRAVVNGQTGRVAVMQAGEPKESYPWVIEPAIMTLATGALLGAGFWYFTGELLWELIGMVMLVFGMIYFAAFSDGRGAEFQAKIFQSKEGQASRTGRRLIIEEAETGSALPDPIAANGAAFTAGGFGSGRLPSGGNDAEAPQYRGTALYSKAAPPVFFESVAGKDVPVILKFYTPLRILFAICFALVFNLLPQLLGGLLLACGLFYPPLEWHYGFGWLALSLPFTVIFWVAIGRIRIYNHPLVLQILGNGQTKAVTADRDKGNSIAKNVRDMFLLALAPGIRWLTLGILIMLLGFTLAMLPL